LVEHVEFGYAFCRITINVVRDEDLVSEFSLHLWLARIRGM
jgi:hypothetical protein